MAEKHAAYHPVATHGCAGDKEPAGSVPAKVQAAVGLESQHHHHNGTLGTPGVATAPATGGVATTWEVSGAEGPHGQHVGEEREAECEDWEDWEEDLDRNRPGSGVGRPDYPPPRAFYLPGHNRNWSRRGRVQALEYAMGPQIAPLTKRGGLGRSEPRARERHRDPEIIPQSPRDSRSLASRSPEPAAASKPNTRSATGKMAQVSLEKGSPVLESGPDQELATKAPIAHQSKHKVAAAADLFELQRAAMVGPPRHGEGPPLSPRRIQELTGRPPRKAFFPVNCALSRDRHRGEQARSGSNFQSADDQAEQPRHSLSPQSSPVRVPTRSTGQYGHIHEWDTPIGIATCGSSRDTWVQPVADWIVGGGYRLHYKEAAPPVGHTKLNDPDVSACSRPCGAQACFAQNPERECPRVYTGMPRPSVLSVKTPQNLAERAKERQSTHRVMKGQWVASGSSVEDQRTEATFGSPAARGTAQSNLGSPQSPTSPTSGRLPADPAGSRGSYKQPPSPPRATLRTEQKMPSPRLSDRSLGRRRGPSPRLSNQITRLSKGRVSRDSHETEAAAFGAHPAGDVAGCGSAVSGSLGNGSSAVLSVPSGVLRAREAVLGKSSKGFVELRRMTSAVRPGPAQVWWDVADPRDLNPLSGCRWESKPDWLAFRPKNAKQDRRDIWLEFPTPGLNRDTPGWYAGRGGAEEYEDVNPGAGGKPSGPRLLMDFGLCLPRDQAMQPLVVGHCPGFGPVNEWPQTHGADAPLRPRSTMDVVGFEGRMGREQLQRPGTGIGHCPDRFYGEEPNVGEGVCQVERGCESVLEQVGGVEPGASKSQVFASEREAFMVHVALTTPRTPGLAAETSDEARKIELQKQQLRAHLRVAYSAKRFEAPQKPAGELPRRERFRPLRKCVVPA